MLSNLNSILIEGVLTEDPVLCATPKGTAVCRLAIASKRYYRDNDGELAKEFSFFEVEVWSKLAGTCSRLGRKNRGLRVVGRLKEERWIDADGKQNSKVFIVAEHVEWRPEGYYEGR